MNENIKSFNNTYQYSILMFVYYLYPKQKNFEQLKNQLKKRNSDGEMMKIGAITLKPFEFYSECKNSTLPEWLVFHILDLIDNYDLLPEDESIKLNVKNQYFTKYLEYLAKNSLPIKYFNYYYQFSGFIDVILIGDLALKEVNLYFNDIITSKSINLNVIVDKVNEINDILKGYEGMRFYVNCVNKVNILINLT